MQRVICNAYYSTLLSRHSLRATVYWCPFEDFSKASSEAFQLLRTITNIFDHIRKSFPKISEHFRRFPKIFRKFKKAIKTSENYFGTVSENLRRFPNASEDFPIILKNHKTLENTFELFPKISKSFRRLSKISEIFINPFCKSFSITGLKRFRSFRN